MQRAISLPHGYAKRVNSDLVGWQVRIKSPRRRGKPIRGVIDASTLGLGNAGAISITANQTVSFHNDSYVFSRVYQNAEESIALISDKV